MGVVRGNATQNKSSSTLNLDEFDGYLKFRHKIIDKLKSKKIY
jgi:hypothetical protein